MPETGNKSPYRFNPRTYIRYDNIANFPNMGINVSIHVPI